MDALAWYIAGTLIALVLTGVMTACDVWVLGVDHPNKRRKIVMLSARWGFLCGVLVYAWLIDSHRVDYQEPAIWGVLFVGVGLSAMIQMLGRRKE